MNPDVNYGLGVIMTCHVDSLIVTNAPSGGGVLVVGEVVCAGAGGREHMGISVLSAHFFYEPETALKIVY